MSWLAIGRRLTASETAPLCDVRLDLTAELPEPKSIRQSSAYQCLPIPDAHVPAVEALLGCLDQIGERSVFVRCAQGHGRTGLVAAAILLKRAQAFSADDAVKTLQLKWLSQHFSPHPG